MHLLTRGLICVLTCGLSLGIAAESLHFLIPGAAGGGWDRTARATGEALVKANLIDSVSFENMSGGGGAKALAHLIETNRATTLMVNSTPIIVRSLQRIFPQSYRDLTPIASVIGDYSVIAVRNKSPFTSLQQLASEMRKNPRQVAIAGGSVAGGTDHIVAAMVFSALGTPPQAVKYIPYDAGGKAMAGLLSGEVQALSSGYGEVVELRTQGYVRLLCIAAPNRLAIAPDTPSCHEAGAKDAIFVNWRGFFAAPNIPQEQAIAYQELLQRMQTTEIWGGIRQRYGWVDLYAAGQDFEAMLAEQESKLAALLTALGML